MVRLFLVGFDGAGELFLAVVFVSGRLFEGAHRVGPTGRCPTVQHHEDDFFSGDFGDVVAGLASAAAETVVLAECGADHGGHGRVRQVIVQRSVVLLHHASFFCKANIRKTINR